MTDTIETEPLQIVEQAAIETEPLIVEQAAIETEPLIVEQATIDTEPLIVEQDQPTSHKEVHKMNTIISPQPGQSILTTDDHGRHDRHGNYDHRGYDHRGYDYHSLALDQILREQQSNFREAVAASAAAQRDVAGVRYDLAMTAERLTATVLVDSQKTRDLINDRVLVDGQKTRDLINAQEQQNLRDRILRLEIAAAKV